MGSKTNTMKNEITELAKKIDAANKTLANNQELINFVGYFDSPVGLAIAAATKIFYGKGKLSFVS